MHLLTNKNIKRCYTGHHYRIQLFYLQYICIYICTQVAAANADGKKHVLRQNQFARTGVLIPVTVRFKSKSYTNWNRFWPEYSRITVFLQVLHDFLQVIMFSSSGPGSYPQKWLTQQYSIYPRRLKLSGIPMWKTQILLSKHRLKFHSEIKRWSLNWIFNNAK